MRKMVYLLFTITVLIVIVETQISCMEGAKNGNTQVLQGINAYKSGNYELAVKKFKEAIEAGITEYELEEIYTMLGNAYDELDQLDNAIAAHRKAIEINPKCYKAWVNLGIVYRHIGELGEAEKCYTEALHLEPEYAELHASLGALYVFKNEPQKAIEALEKAIELNSQLAVAYGNIALAYAMVDRFEDAEASLKQATVLGYKNWQKVKERIDALKTLRKEKEKSG